MPRISSECVFTYGCAHIQKNPAEIPITHARVRKRAAPQSAPKPIPNPAKNNSLFLKIKVSNVLSDAMWYQKNKERNSKTP